MGGHLSCMYAGGSPGPAIAEPAPPFSSHGVLKLVVACEGWACELAEPLKVAELMLEFPNHFVAEYDMHTDARTYATSSSSSSSSAAAAAAAVVPEFGPTTAVSACSRRISPLPADHDAKLSHTYLIMPMHRLNTRLSTDEINLISALEAAPTSSAASPLHMPLAKVAAPLPMRQRQDAATMTASAVSASSNGNVCIVKGYSTAVLRFVGTTGFETEHFDGSQTGNKNANKVHLHVLRSKSWTPKLETIIENSQLLYL